LNVSFKSSEDAVFSNVSNIELVTMLAFDFKEKINIDFSLNNFKDIIR